MLCVSHSQKGKFITLPFFDFLCNLTITEISTTSGSKHGFKKQEKEVIYWIDTLFTMSGSNQYQIPRT